MQHASKGDDQTVETTSRDGAISRRTWLGGAATALCAGAACLGTQRALAQQKVKQADAKYQTSPKGSAKCGDCMQFQAPSSCKLVDGSIDPNGWCQLFTPKAHG